MIELKESQLPYNTEVLMNVGDSLEIHILKETEKALLLCYTQLVRRGTSMVSDRKEHTFWCPKSVWFNDENFTNHKDSLVFNPPYFLRK